MDSAPALWVSVTPDPLDDGAARRFVDRPEHGAALVFYGVVRNVHEGRAVEAVEYAAYVAMAESELAAVAREAVLRHGAGAAAVLHRIGRLAVGETSLVVAVGSRHRGPAFAAGLALIDELKRRVPIWKREIGPDGTRWQDGELPGPA